jgi:hypothetical protein
MRWVISIIAVLLVAALAALFAAGGPRFGLADYLSLAALVAGTAAATAAVVLAHFKKARIAWLLIVLAALIAGALLVTTFLRKVAPAAAPPPPAVKLWPFGLVEVCWENLSPDDASLAHAVADAAAAWQVKDAHVAFEGWGACPSGDFPGVRLRASHAADDRPHVADVLGADLVNVRPGLTLVFDFDPRSRCERSPDARKQCVFAEAVHEFGHVLGRDDNHLSRFAPENCKSEFRELRREEIDEPYEADSVMNECSPNRFSGVLGSGDLQWVKAHYGEMRDDFAFRTEFKAPSASTTTSPSAPH